MPEISIDVGELRKRKILVTTPMYGGMCGGQYTKSTADLAKLAMQYQMTIDFFYLFNESLITRARNYCCDEFMRSDATHMIFIDSDIGFDARDVISMMALMDHEDEENPYDILCSPYPKKCIAWEKIKQAVDQGQADEDPNILDNFVGDYVFNPVHGTTEISLDEPAEVLEGGTGFIQVEKEVKNLVDMQIMQNCQVEEFQELRNPPSRQHSLKSASRKPQAARPQGPQGKSFKILSLIHI